MQNHTIGNISDIDMSDHLHMTNNGSSFMQQIELYIIQP